jgi:DNA-binding SARP family transcriptional activator
MAAARQPTTHARGVGAVKLQLLGNFAVLVAGSAVAVPPAGQRVLARLALGGGTATRSAVAGTLWPDHTQARAQANLRGAVWRMPPAVRRRLVLGPSTVGLGDGWDVDVAAAERLARVLPAPDPDPETSGERFRHDLLPDWDEPWLLVERERYRQLRLHALEDLAEAELASGCPLGAVDRALLAVAAEPLRESAQALLLRAHLAAGNRAAARAGYDAFRALLAEELGVAPSAKLSALVAGLGPGR